MPEQWKCDNCGAEQSFESSNKCGWCHKPRPEIVTSFIEQEWSDDGVSYRKVVSGKTSRIERLRQKNQFSPGEWDVLGKVEAEEVYGTSPAALALGPLREATDKKITELGLPTDAKVRKDLPIFSGVLRYFPDALAAVAELSRIGNDQHNPGEPLHWARSKSGDEWDALTRHLLEVGTIDTDGVRHAAKVAWRALAGLQKEIELAAGVDKSNLD